MDERRDQTATAGIFKASGCFALGKDQTLNKVHITANGRDGSKTNSHFLYLSEPAEQRCRISCRLHNRSHVKRVSRTPLTFTAQHSCGTIGFCISPSLFDVENTLDFGNRRLPYVEKSKA